MASCWLQGSKKKKKKKKKKQHEEEEAALTQEGSEGEGVKEEAAGAAVQPSVSFAEVSAANTCPSG